MFDAVGMHVECQASEPRKRRRRSASRRKPDGRTWVVRRARELATLYAARLGEIASDASMTVAIGKAAELTAIAETMRAHALRGDPAVLPDDLVRVQRLADQAVKQLGIKPGPAKPKGPSLSEYLESKAAERPA